MTFDLMMAHNDRITKFWIIRQLCKKNVKPHNFIAIQPIVIELDLLKSMHCRGSVETSSEIFDANRKLVVNPAFKLFIIAVL